MLFLTQCRNERLIFPHTTSARGKLFWLNLILCINIKYYRVKISLVPKIQLIFINTKYNYFFQFLLINNDMIYVWHIDPLLGSDREIGDRTVAVARRRSRTTTGGWYLLRGPRRWHNNRRMMFTVRSVPRSYKEGELVGGVSELEDCCSSVLVSCCC
jgi:hypothetical protein